MATTRSMRAMLSTLLAAGALLAPVAIRAQDTPDTNDDRDTVRRAIHVCASCHGEGGRSLSPAIPSLAGQTPQYTASQLKDFRYQRRTEAGTQAYMWGVSALLDNATILGLAEYYAAQTPPTGRSERPALLRTGRQIYEEGVPARRVRACAACHGTNAEGANEIPRLAGQHADYVFAQLKVFNTRLRSHGTVMEVEAALMKPAEMRAVAEYVQSK